MAARDLITKPLTQDERAGLLEMLREARAQVLRDAEAFHRAASVLEHFGQAITGESRTNLGKYENDIHRFADRAPEISRERIAELCRTVRMARNDAVHGGAYIRHHSCRLVELLLILEESIMASATQVKDLMVRNPVVAERWHNLASARRAMLANALSYLPIKDGSRGWRLLPDFALLAVVQPQMNAKSRNDGLGHRLDELIDSKRVVLCECEILRPDELIADVFPKVECKPAIVIETVDKDERVVGILSAFDLL